MTPSSGLLGLLFLCIVSLVSAAIPEPDHTSTIYVWPLSAPSPAPLAQVKYNAGTRSTAYKPLSTPALSADPFSSNKDIVRVGVKSTSGQWIGTVTTAQTVSGNPAITLRLDDGGEVWGVEFEKGTGEEGVGVVSVVRAKKGVDVELNRPVVLDATGKIPVPEVEKTWLQKYWWLLLAGAVLIIGGGGGGE